MSENKPKTEKLEETKIIVDEKVETANVVPIEYSKYNPKLPFNLNNIWWNVLKYGLAISLMIFCILSLYFSTTWQAQSNGALAATGSLIQIKIISVSGDWMFTDAYNNLYKGDADMLQRMKDLNLIAQSIKSKSLYDLVPWFNNEILTSLMAFAILGVITIIPLLIFKNGTVCSFVNMILAFIFLAIVIGLFATGIAAQNTILYPYKDVADTVSKIKSLTDAKNPEYANEIIRLKDHLILAMDNLKNIASI